MSELLPLTSANLEAYPWQDQIDACPIKQCNNYTGVFGAELRRCELRGDAVGTRVYGLIGFVAHCSLRHDNNKHPFAPGDGSGGASPEMISTEDLTVLTEIVERIRDPEYCARVADILWECCRPRIPRHAELAVINYSKSVEHLEGTTLWPPVIDRLRRAWVLASRLGRERPLFASVLNLLEKLLTKHSNNPDSGLFCAELLGLVSDLGQDEARYGQFAEAFATKLEQKCNWDFASRYWRLASEFYRKAGDQAGMQRALLSGAECWPQHAEAILSEDKLGATAAAHWMSVAVQALRNAKAAPERIKQVHLRLIELQNQSMGEMRPLSVRGDQIPGITEAYEKTVAASAQHVGGKAFQEAIFHLAELRTPVDPKEVRKSVEKQSEEFVFMRLFPSVAKSSTGRVEDQSPSMSATEEALREESLQDAMIIQCKMIYWDMAVKWSLDPARRQILADHEARLNDLAFLVVDNPFIPPGHEGIFLEGIHAGFHGDLLLAMHYLIPQLEAAIRMIFQRRGIITSTLESDSTQGERDLGWLLTHEETTKIFGNMAFSFKGILISRFGYNLRNNMAHGLLSEGEFYCTGALYLWWLMLRVLVRGHLLVHNEVQL